MILVEIIASSLLLSLCTGGSLKNLEHERLTGGSLLAVLLPLQLAWPGLTKLGGVGCGTGLTVWLLMMAMLVIVLAWNAGRRWALGIAALGILLNILVIGANGAMPVSMRSISEIGGSRLDAIARLEGECLHEVLDASTRLVFLGDVIAVPGPDWQRGVVSLGDLLLAGGLGAWAFVAARSTTQESATSLP